MAGVNQGGTDLGYPAYLEVRLGGGGQSALWGERAGWFLADMTRNASAQYIHR